MENLEDFKEITNNLILVFTFKVSMAYNFLNK